MLVHVRKVEKAESVCREWKKKGSEKGKRKGMDWYM